VRSDLPQGSDRPAVSVALVTPAWERFAETIERSFLVLYEPFGLKRPDASLGEDDWRLPPEGTIIAVALGPDSELLGSAWLLPVEGDVSRKVRQVAVEFEAQRRGVGAALVRALEQVAAEQGAAETRLDSRDTAYRFYERLGYVAEGEEFISELTGIPHRPMRKRLV
jgi:GNAT superfamily N-acetyltransferase